MLVQGIIKDREEVMLKNLRNLSARLHLSAEQAMDALDISLDERDCIRKKLTLLMEGYPSTVPSPCHVACIVDDGLHSMERFVQEVLGVLLTPERILSRLA